MNLFVLADNILYASGKIYTLSEVIDKAVEIRKVLDKQEKAHKNRQKK